MRRFLAQVVLNALTIFVVLFLFSLLHISYTSPISGKAYDGPAFAIGTQPVLTIVAFSILLALVEAVLRPALLILSGRLLLRSMGLVMVAINVLLVLLTIYIAPGDFTIADPGWFWGTIIALVFTLLSSSLQVIVGVNRPHIDVSNRNGAIWRVLDRLPTPRRSKTLENLRLLQVYDTVAAYGLEIGLEQTPLAGIRNRFQHLVGGTDPEIARLSTPGKVRVMLQQLGPTYVKVGQMIASRAEALPPDWREELRKLQNTVPPFPYAQVEATIVKELGATPDQLYATFDHEALAAASLAQVHRATLIDGRQVAVKVQRPDVQAMVTADLGVMQDLAGVMEDKFEIARKLDAKGILEEFAAGVLTELDYRSEAYHMRRLDENMKTIPNVRVPAVYGDRCTSRVLTMDFVRGVKITDVDAIAAAGLDRDDIARRFMKAIIKQLLVDGFFHADPHPGNVFVDTSDGTIVFLDLGLIGQLTRDQRFDLMDLMWSVVQQDSAGIASVMTRMSVQHGPVDPAAVKRAVDRVVFQYLKFGGNGGDFGAAITNILGSLYDNGLRLNQDFTLAIKAIVQVEEIARILSPGFDFLALGVADARDLLVTEVSPEKISATIQQTVVQTGKELARRVPDLQTAAIGWIDQFQKGKVVVEISTADLNTELGRIGLIGRALAAGMIMAGAIIATGIVFMATLLSDKQLTFILPVPFLLLVLFVALLVIGLREARSLLGASE